ncbi:MAG: glycosyltransferase, partial [Flavobacteriales bacterium]|nr:glycosyltransferase [Flavobacteriales bacterium]
MIKVCHFTTVHGDHDDRIFFKMCRSLTAAGFRTIQVASGTRDGEEDGVLLRGVRVPSWRLFRATIGAWRVYRAVLRTGAMIVHFHDPELIGVGLLLKRKGRTVIFDMHELVRSQIMDKAWLGPTWFRRIIVGAYAAIERQAVQRFDAIVLAESGYAGELLQMYPEQRAKFHVIRNLPVLAIIDRTAVDQHRGDPFTIIYVGGLSRIRGIRELIDAMGHVEGARLRLLGWWESDEFRRSC